jgi:hypothetical protein
MPDRVLVVMARGGGGEVDLSHSATLAALLSRRVGQPS